MVLCCCCDLYGVVAAPFSECAVRVVCPLLALTSCFATVSNRPFNVHTCGLYVPVYSFDAFSSLSMLVVWVCGAVGICLDIHHFLSLVRYCSEKLHLQSYLEML